MFRMEPTEQARIVAQRVNATITAAGLSQREVSRTTGISLPTLNRKLNGHRPFDIAELYAVARLADTPITTFIPEGVA